MNLDITDTDTEIHGSYLHTTYIQFKETVVIILAEIIRITCFRKVTPFILDSVTLVAGCGYVTQLNS
jgi:hypothetical protein